MALSRPSKRNSATMAPASPGRRTGCVRRHGFKQDSDENVPSLSNLQASEILKELESDKEAQIYTGNIIEMQGKTAHISIGQVPIGTGHQQKPITVEHALDIQGNITEGGFDLNLVIERKTFAPEKIAD